MNFCFKCRKEIKPLKIGGFIYAEEVIVCEDCYEAHINTVIKAIDNFRTSKNFLSIIKLRKFNLWLSEQRYLLIAELSKVYEVGQGKRNDLLPDKVAESVSDYDDYSLRYLQDLVIDTEITLLDNLLPDILSEWKLSLAQEKINLKRKKLLNILRSGKYGTS